MAAKRILIGHLFNFNIQFAEMPVDRSDLLVSQGHEPLLDLLDRHPKVKCDLFLTGYTDLWLAQNAPGVIDRIKRGVGEGRFGIGTYTYAHPVLSLLPYDGVVRQLARGLECDGRVWGLRPRGLLLPEVAWDVTLPKAMDELGIEWVAIYKEIVPELAVKRSYPGSAWALGAMDSRAKAVLGNRVLGKQIQSVLRGELPAQRVVDDIAEILDDAEEEQLILLKQDAEVLYFMSMPWYMEKRGLSHGSELPRLDAAERFDDLLTRLEALPGVEFVRIQEYLDRRPPMEEVCPECISGHADMDKWTRGEGRERLNVLTDTAREDMRSAERAVALAELLGCDVRDARRMFDEAKDQLMLAENSDGRAFVPHFSRKAAVATAALKASQLATGSISAIRGGW